MGVELEAVLSTELFHAISVVPGVGLDLYVVARDVSWDSVSRYVRMLTYAHVCSRMLTYAHVCWRMLAYAGGCYVIACDVSWDSVSRYTQFTCFTSTKVPIRTHARDVTWVC